MEWVETTGRTVHDAVEAALTVLGVDESDLEYEVLAEAKGGLLGRFGGSPARIRARVKPISREKPNDRRRRNKRERGEGGGSRPGGGSGRGQGRNRSGGSDEPRAPREPKPADGARDAAPAAERGDEGQAGGGNRRRRRGGSGRSSGGAGEQVVEKSSVPVEEQAKIAEEFLVGLVRSLDRKSTRLNSSHT